MFYLPQHDGIKEKILDKQTTIQKMKGCNTDVKEKLAALYDDIFGHEGYGHLEVSIKILHRGQKEVIIRCGKEYRFVVDFPPSSEKTERSGKAEATAAVKTS